MFDRKTVAQQRERWETSNDKDLFEVVFILDPPPAVARKPFVEVEPFIHDQLVEERLSQRIIGKAHHEEDGRWVVALDPGIHLQNGDGFQIEYTEKVKT